MNRTYSKIWNRARNALVVASELARGAGKGKTVQRPRARRTITGAAFALTLAGTLGIAQAANVSVNADNTTETLNGTDTYIKIDATNNATVDADGNAVAISDAVAGSAIVEIEGGSTLLLDGGGVLENTDTTAIWSYGLEIRGAGSTATLKGLAVNAHGKDSWGVYAHDGAHVTLEDGVQVTTVGDDALGVGAFDAGTEISMIGGSIATRGEGTASNPNGADGVVAVNGANMTLTDVAIEIDGDDSRGIFAFLGGQVSMAGGSIAVHGDAVDDISAGVYAVADGSVTLTDGVAISTDGVDALGVRLDDGSQLTMQDSTIETTGDGVAPFSGGAAGLYVSDDSVAQVTGGSITTTGADSVAVIAVADSTVELDGTSIVTTGDSLYNTLFGSAGVSVADASLTLTNASVTTSGQGAMGIVAIEDATLTLQNTHVETRGDNNNASPVPLPAEAAGVVVGTGATAAITGGSITTEGEEAFGVVVEDASVTLTDVDVETFGDDAFGIHAGTDAQVNMAGGSIAMHGEGVFDSVLGIAAEDGAQVTLTDGVAISVDGDYSYGIGAVSAGTEVSMTGGSITVSGLGYGAMVGDNATLTLDQVAIDIQDLGVGVMAQDGQLSMLDSTVTTQAEDTAGVVVLGPDSQLTLQGTTVQTSGATTGTNGLGAFGVYVVGGASANIADSRITTSGQDSLGLAAMNDVTLTVKDTDIVTTGDNTGATGALPGGIPELGAAGAVIGMASTVTFTGGSISTQGADAAGLVLVDAADVTLTDTRIDASGAALHWWLDDSAVTAAQTLTANNTDLTQNNGHLLDVTGGNISTALTLALDDGTRAAGDITDVASAPRVTLDLQGGSQWTGNTRLDGNLILSDTGTATHGGSIGTPIAIAGDVTVNNGATLGGNLDVAGALALNGGILAPGNSIGSQTFASVSGSGDYHAEINSAGDADLITVTASDFDVSAIDLYVSGESGNGGYQLDHEYTIAKTENGHQVQGAFANGGKLEGSLSQALVQLDPVLYGNDFVQISLSLDDDKVTAARDGLSGNQNAALDSVISAVGSNPAADAAVSSADYAGALDQLSGELHASTQTALLDSSDLMVRTLSERLRSRSGAGIGGAAAGPDELADQDNPTWIRAVRKWSRFDGGHDTAQSRYDAGGVYLGADAHLGNGWLVGGALGFLDGRVQVKDRASRADVNSYSAALYGGKSWALASGQLNWLAGVGYSYHDIDTRRDVTVGGAQRLKASYHAWTLPVFTELGYRLPVGANSAVEPYLGVAWIDQHAARFHEKGGPAALDGKSDNNDVTTATLGVRAQTHFHFDGADGRLMAGAGWRHAEGDLDGPRHLTLHQGGTRYAEVVGAPIDRDAGIANLAAEVNVSSHAAVGLGYTGQYGSNNQDHTGSVYLHMMF